MFEQQISILEWFLNDRVSNDAENSAFYHRNELHLKYIQLENSYLKS